MSLDYKNKIISVTLTFEETLFINNLLTDHMESNHMQ